MKKCWKDKEKTKILSFGYLNFFSTHVPVKSVPLPLFPHRPIIVWQNKPP